jgi:transposase
VRNKVDLYERIRRDHARHEWGIHRLAREHGCHRRDIRRALASAVPPPRKAPEARQPVLGPWKAVIDAILAQDRTVPRKQRHTSRRILARLAAEHGATISERTVSEYVRQRKRETVHVAEVMVPQHHEPGQEAEVDFSEALVDFSWGREKVNFFQMRACASAKPLHWSVRSLVQQAFLEAHVESFEFFGGVFHTIRYDNLTLAVKKVLRGRQRIEHEQFVLLRSHYLFDAVFCRPGLKGAHEKGGVEGEVGYFRRNHLVPIPKVASWAELIELCRRGALIEERRHIDSRPQTIGEHWEKERPHLKSLPTERFDSRRHVSARADPKARVNALRNRYSVPVALSDQVVGVAVSSTEVVVTHQGRRVAQHERLYGIGGDRLELDHYLEVLRYKPRALAGSIPLRQAIDRGTFPEAYRTFLAELQARLGESEGARQMVDVLFLHRSHGAPAVVMAVEEALLAGAFSFAAVALTVRRLSAPPPVPIAVPHLHVLHNPTVPVPDCTHYDQLLHTKET